MLRELREGSSLHEDVLGLRPLRPLAPLLKEMRECPTF